jgi:hypothetical protein
MEGKNRDVIQGPVPECDQDTMKNATNNFGQISVFLVSSAPMMNEAGLLLGHHVSLERYIKVACHIVFDVLQLPNQTFYIRMWLFQAIPAAYVFSHSVTGMAGSNSSKGKDVSLLCMLCVV